MPIPPGRYEKIITEALNTSLPDLEPDLCALVVGLDPTESPARLAQYLRQCTERTLETTAPEHRVSLANALLQVLQNHQPETTDAGDALRGPLQQLLSIHATGTTPMAAPQTLLSADRVDLICAFIPRIATKKKPAYSSD